MVPMIFAGNTAWKPRKDDRRTSEPHDTDCLLEYGRAGPRSQREKNILAGGIAAIEKPDVVDAKFRHGLAAFDLAHQAEGFCMLAPDRVGTRISARAVHNCNTFVLVENGAGKISGDDGVIVWMRDDEQDVSFVAIVWSGDLGEATYKRENNGKENGNSVAESHSSQLPSRYQAIVVPTFNTNHRGH